jgi:hypothetical protein
MDSINTVNAELLQGYTRRFSDVLIERAFYGALSLQDFLIITGIKGEEVLTELLIGKLLKRASADFRPRANSINYGARKISTVALDADILINPKKFANSYLESMRQKGQNGKDLPFEGQVMAGLVNKLVEEIEFAIWQAEETSTPNADDLMMLTFNGIIKQCKMIRAGSGYSPINVSGGSYTETNIYPNFKDMFLSLGAEATMDGVIAHGSKSNLFKYIENYKTIHKGIGPELMFTEGTKKMAFAAMLPNATGWYYARPGYGASNLVVMTQPNNFVYGTDDMQDTKNFKVVDQIKSIEMTLATRIGVGIRIDKGDYLAMNDLN